MPTLEFLTDPAGRTQRIQLSPLPFILGRGASAHFVIRSHLVSKEHAEIHEREGRLWIRDLDSRNGTFVNGQKIDAAALSERDIIHIAHSEFRFHGDQVEAAATESGPLPETELTQCKIPPSVLYGRPLLQEMLQKQSVRVIFQPIVALQTRDVIGFEALGRGSFPDLSTRPTELFRLASRCSLAVELSRAFRDMAIQRADMLPEGTRIFCNLHPEEFAQLQPDGFDQLLPELPAQHQLVLEIHEDAVAEVELLRQFRDFLKSRGVGLAYDDFGAGQSRLAELAEVPPDFIKLDMRLIRNLHTASGRRDVVQAICNAALKLGVTVIAEGLERQEELEVCQQLGCHLGQGFLLGHPERAEA